MSQVYSTIPIAHNRSHRSIFRYHPEWGWIYRPNVRVRFASTDARFPSYFVETNADGFRCRHTRTDMGASPRRSVVIIGCSFAAGNGISNNKRFGDRLEDFGDGLLVYNAALTGSGHDQQLLILRNVVRSIQAEAIVIAPFTGCIIRNITKTRKTYDRLLNRPVKRPKPSFEIEDGDLSPVGPRVPKPTMESLLAQAERPVLSNGKEGLGDAVRSLSRAVAHRFKSRNRVDAMYSNLSDPGNILAKKLLGAMIDSAEASGARVILAPMPGIWDLRARRPAFRDFFQTLSREAGATFVDVHQELRRAFRGAEEEIFLTGEGHYTPAAHEKVAALLRDQLSDGGGSHKRPIS